ncbi:hypothetical protein NRIC_08600 [Enterococcus florum]|uniref:Uncharacterized protein n=1 Tax=Enterococcus florum TaxID=2480627 RepID=A0A4V0WP84_9ENTE|nr:hypothetical protein [Enterococcus florum]GCF92969.1 hypothetical protein NRIC_08600 [Enterococcus florum]
MKKWKQGYARLDLVKKRRLWVWLIVMVLFFSVYIGATSFYLHKDRTQEEKYWTHYLNEKDQLTPQEETIAAGATRVNVGLYMENINEINIRNSYYTVTFQVWFKWQDNPALDMIENCEIYQGQIISSETLKDTTTGNIRYQLARVTAKVSKTFWTTRFPLSSYQLRMYLEPKASIEDILFVPDKENATINPNINVAGFDLQRFDTNLFVQEYANSKGDPEIEAQNESYVVTEYLAAMELNRDSIGLYIKCFIALVGTLGWVLIVLFICTYHNVDPLSMIPGALFGTVSNILVGANLVPDALHTGLLEFVNVFGILIILFASFAIITINRMRTYHEDDQYASFFGKHVFWLLTFFTILGNVVIPMAAYNFH